MIPYIRTILYQYATDLLSKEYKEKYRSASSGWRSKHNDGVYDKTRKIITYNWRQKTIRQYSYEHKDVYNRNLVSVASLPMNYCQ